MLVERLAWHGDAWCCRLSEEQRVPRGNPETDEGGVPAELVALQVRRSLFLNVSLCLCRACLGKTIKLGINGATVPPPRPPPPFSPCHNKQRSFGLPRTVTRTSLDCRRNVLLFQTATGHLLGKEKENSTETTVVFCRRRPMRSPSAAQKVRTCLVSPLPFPFHETRSVATTGSGRTQ